MSPILVSRNRMMNTFIMVTLTPHVRDSSYDQSMLFHSKKALLFPSVWPGTEYTSTLIQEELTKLLWKPPGYYLFPHRQSTQECEDFVKWLILTLYVRDSLEDK